jgi:hypothetical protein
MILLGGNGQVISGDLFEGWENKCLLWESRPSVQCLDGSKVDISTELWADFCPVPSEGAPALFYGKSVDHAQKVHRRPLSRKKPFGGDVLLKWPAETWTVPGCKDTQIASGCVLASSNAALDAR